MTGVSISDGLLELDRVVRQENGYADAPEDHIMNGEQQSQELVTGRLATVDDRREQQFLLEFSTSGKTQSLLTLTPKYIYSTLRTDLTMSYDTGSADLYYVYGKGKLIAILSSPAEAVQLVERLAQEFVNDLFSTLRERMLDLRYCKVVFVGGGAILLRRQIEESGKVGTPLFVTHINANAAGFEYLYRLETVGR